MKKHYSYFSVSPQIFLGASRSYYDLSPKLWAFLTAVFKLIIRISLSVYYLAGILVTLATNQRIFSLISMNFSLKTSCWPKKWNETYTPNKGGAS